MMKELLPEIIHDLRKWRAGDALDTERDDNIFEPNTVAFMARCYPGLRIEPWGAESVIDQVARRILADTRDSGDLAYEQIINESTRKSEFQRRSAKGSKTRTANQLKVGGTLPDLQRRVFAAEEALTRNAPDRAILQWLLYDAPENRRHPDATLFNVKRARQRLRDKGL